MTAADWKQAEEQTVRMFGGCKLLVDGYSITIGMRPKSAYKNEIAIYIDGKFQWKWCTEDCEIRRRFCRTVTRSAITTQRQRDILKKMSKKDQAATRERMRYHYYLPSWDSFASLKRHLLANNSSIELAAGGENDGEL